jgi:outer membrane protein assembly factor BamB
MKRCGVLAIVLLATAATARAENWPQWRGPNFNGSSEAKNLPAEFGPTKNAVWVADLPGPSAATPVVWEDRVFVSSTDVTNASETSKQSLLTMCFDRKDGKLLWQHEVAQGIQKNYHSNFSSPSPVTNGEVVVFFFGNGIMVAYDLDGKKQWERSIQDGQFAFMWTFSTSPVLCDGKLILQVLQRDTPVRGAGPSERPIESYLLALDPSTGKTLWRHVRPSKAKAESLEAFTTPMPIEIEGRPALLVAGGDALTAHDLKTGKELWRWGTWNPERIGHWRLVPSPVAGDGVAVVCAPKGSPVYAIKTNGQGVLDDSYVAWTTEGNRDVSSDVPTPAFYDGDFFVLYGSRQGSRKSLSRLDPETGEVQWSTQLPDSQKYESSPLAADGKIYVVNFDGLVVVVNAADGSILQQVSLDAPQQGETVRSSIIAAHGQLFVRTTRKLYCFGE